MENTTEKLRDEGFDCIEALLRRVLKITIALDIVMALVFAGSIYLHASGVESLLQSFASEFEQNTTRARLWEGLDVSCAIAIVFRDVCVYTGVAMALVWTGVMAHRHLGVFARFARGRMT